MPILVGLDGRMRMSKSTGNFIGVDEAPEEQYGKAMSLPDEVLENFFTLATNLGPRETAAIIEELGAGRRDPMSTKKLLARTIVTEMHSEEAARNAEAHFERTVQQHEVPEDIPEHRFSPGQSLVDVITAAGLAPSRREARRLLEQGAVTFYASSSSAIEGDTVGLDSEPGAGVLQVGKRRWVRLVAE
jgi:tyrosyl-tRNA synthetase